MSDITGKKVIKQIEVGGVNYSLDAEYFGSLSADEWKSLIKAGFSVKKVASLPTASADTLQAIYLVAHSHQTGDSYDEYVTVVGGTDAAPTYSWEKIGNTDLDISSLANDLVVGANTAGLATGEAGAQTATGSATISYMKSATETGSAGAGTANSNTGNAGGATINGSSFGFSGTEQTITLSGTLPTLSAVEVTPAGSITGSATVTGHTHSITPTTATLTYVSGTANQTGSASGHTHSVTLNTASFTYVSGIDASTGSESSHTHSIDATKVTNWSGGSASLTSKNYGFSSSTSNVMSAPTVSAAGVLSWTTSSASAQDSLSWTSATATLTGATVTGDGGAHSHTIGKSTASLTYATGSVKSVGEAGGHTHSIGAATTATLTVVTGVSATGSAGGHTINGSSFGFSGSKLTFTPALSTNALSVSGKLTPSGSITGSATLSSHSHTYTAPSAHTHGITLATATVTGTASVAVSSHTHSIAAHTHTISKKSS